MAYSYNRSHSRNSSTGLGSSISCLDGVPFKVGPKFKPPPRVFLPPDLSDAPKKSEILSEEYLFETEEAVLRWAQAREEAKVEQERLKAERVASAIQDLSKPQNGEVHNSSGEEDGTANVQAFPLLPPENPQPPPRPAFANMSNDILTPVPIGPAKVMKENKVETPQAVNLDLALFEREDDPFENVERQLINEMEELKSLLDPSKPSSNNPPANTSNDCDTNITNGISNSPAVDTSVPKQALENVPSAQQTPAPAVPVFVPRRQPYEEGDYVELRLDQQENSSVAFKAGETTHNDFQTGQGSSRRKVDPSASNIYKSVLPPIGPPATKERPLSTPDVNSLLQSHASASPASVTGLSNGVDDKNSQCNFSSPVEMMQHSDASLRSTRSNPDLSNSETQVNNNKVFPHSHSPPPRPSSGQMWNPYKPLPPTPDIMSTSVHSQSSSCSDLASPSEFDPYSNLSHEAQRFVNNLVSMGFSRPQVARAVHQHGTDEKEVVEYLCHVTKLTEKGFNPVLAESALNMFDNNATKAETYLEMFMQFRELGFGEEKIREALVKENMDRDKVLDYLTA